MNNINIGPVFDNPETEIRLAFGNQVSTERVISFVERQTQLKLECGLISFHEAIEIVNQIKNKLNIQ